MNFWLKIREPVVSAFILFNVISIAIILVPGFPGKESLLSQDVVKPLGSTPNNENTRVNSSWWPPFKPYLMATGLFQGKGVFVPRPHIYEVWLSADVYFQDGSKVEWNNLQMQNLGILERAQKERFRHWGRINVNTNVPLQWWPETARWIARQHFHDGKIPVVVVLRRHRVDTPAPGSTTSIPPVNEPIFKYLVTIKDLQFPGAPAIEPGSAAETDKQSSSAEDEKKPSSTNNEDKSKPAIDNGGTK